VPVSAQRYYQTTLADDQTFTSEGTVRRVDTAAPAANTSTTVTWTSTTSSEKTVLPGAAQSADGDTSNNSGWSFNNATEPALASVAGAQAWVRAGVWNFSVAVTLNSPGLLSTISCRLTARVRRVATGGGSRSALFSAQSAVFSASGTITWNSAAQPEFVLGPGEVLLVSFTATSAATSNTLGGTTNTVLTIALGANTWFQVPSPGIGRLAIGEFTAAGVSTPTVVGASQAAGVFSAQGSANAQAVGASRAAGVFAGAGASDAQAVGASTASAVFAAAGASSPAWRGTGVFSGVFSAAGNAAANAVGTAIFAGLFSAIGSSTSDGRASAIFSGVFNAAGVAGGTFAASAVSGAVFEGAGSSVGAFRGGLIAGAVFTAAVNTGGTTTVVRPIFVFDD
jgi:hypothetical protein